MISKIIFLFVTLFGIGKIKKIPGSVASLATTIFLFFLLHILKISPNFILAFVIIIFFISLYAVNIFIKDLENKDPKEVVVDEFIGQSIPICLYEISHEGTKETSQVLTFYFIMFILFRIFDIAKPYPVSYYDKTLRIVLALLWMIFVLDCMLLLFSFYIWLLLHEKTFAKNS